MKLFPNLSINDILDGDNYIIRGLVATAKGVAMIENPNYEEG